MSDTRTWWRKAADPMLEMMDVKAGIKFDVQEIRTWPSGLDDFITEQEWAIEQGLAERPQMRLRQNNERSRKGAK